MLVLNRKRGEQIIINGCITITVVQMSSTSVRLRVEAPDGMPVHYTEVAEALAIAEREKGGSENDL